MFSFIFFAVLFLSSVFWFISNPLFFSVPFCSVVFLSSGFCPCSSLLLFSLILGPFCSFIFLLFWIFNSFWTFILLLSGFCSFLSFWFLSPSFCSFCPPLIFPVFVPLWSVLFLSSIFGVVVIFFCSSFFSCFDFSSILDSSFILSTLGLTLFLCSFLGFPVLEVCALGWTIFLFSSFFWGVLTFLSSFLCSVLFISILFCSFFPLLISLGFLFDKLCELFTCLGISPVLFLLLLCVLVLLLIFFSSFLFCVSLFLFSNFAARFFIEGFGCSGFCKGFAWVWGVIFFFSSCLVDGLLWDGGWLFNPGFGPGFIVEDFWLSSGFVGFFGIIGLFSSCLFINLLYLLMLLLPVDAIFDLSWLKKLLDCNFFGLFSLLSFSGIPCSLLSSFTASFVKFLSTTISSLENKLIFLCFFEKIIISKNQN